VIAERRLRVQFVADVGDVEVPGATVRRRSGRFVELAFDPRSVAAHGVIAEIAARYDIDDLHVDEPPIEEVVAQFYARHALEA
jgi:ABC-2 type transport system ATP-binding protein